MEAEENVNMEKKVEDLKIEEYEIDIMNTKEDTFEYNNTNAEGNSTFKSPSVSLLEIKKEDYVLPDDLQQKNVDLDIMNTREDTFEYIKTTAEDNTSLESPSISLLDIKVEDYVLPSDLEQRNDDIDKNNGNLMITNNSQLDGINGLGNNSSIRSTILKVKQLISEQGKQVNNVKYIRAYSREERYRCLKCNKSFNTPNHLKMHSNTHTGEKPYKCEICDKRFNQPSALTVHNRIHTGEKPYKCELCDKCFGGLGNMKRHKLVHTGEKPYNCKKCDKSFTQASCLKLHDMTTHTGKKPYKCQKCDSSFSEARKLKRHEKVHTSE